MIKKYMICKKINKPTKRLLWWGSFDTLEESKLALDKAQKKEPKEIFKIYTQKIEELNIDFENY